MKSSTRKNNFKIGSAVRERGMSEVWTVDSVGGCSDKRLISVKDSEGRHAGFYYPEQLEPADLCADGCPRGCQHDRVTKDYTKPTHTPGPWTTDTGGYPIIINGPDNEAENGGIVCIIEDPDKPDAFTVKDDARNEANARLIAAAPDLLAALKAKRDIAGPYFTKGARVYILGESREQKMVGDFSGDHGIENAERFAEAMNDKLWNEQRLDARAALAKAEVR